MSRYVVIAPAPGHTGPVGGVHFQDGVAEVDDATHGAELAYMRNAGYDVREATSAAEANVGLTPDEVAAMGQSDLTEKPKKTAPVAEWRAYAVSKGLSAEEAEGLTKNQLVERFDEEDAS